MGEMYNDAICSEDLKNYFSRMPEITHTLARHAIKTLSEIQNALYEAPSFIQFITDNCSSEATLQAVLTNDQKQKLKSGVLKLLSRKDGKLCASLVDPSTNQIAANIPLEYANLSPDISQMTTDFAMQMQLAQVAEQMQELQRSIEDIQQGLENDRLATAYSCQQKFLQVMSLKNSEIKKQALLQIAFDAEDSRNLLMLSQNENIAFIDQQPESSFQKLFSGASSKEIHRRMEEIRKSLEAVNAISLTEAMVYHELGESEAAQKSLVYYAEYLDQAYFGKESLLKRLDLLDPAPVNYWSEQLPTLKQKILALPYMNAEKLLEEK